MTPSKPAHPDDMQGITDEVYKMQAHQFPDSELKNLKRQDLSVQVFKERKLKEARGRTVSIQAELNRIYMTAGRKLTAEKLLKDVKL
jgi:hypothetical protein